MIRGILCTGQDTYCMLFLIFPQSGLAAPVKCTINQTEWKVSSQSINLKWGSLGNPCNFSVTCSSHNTLYRVCQPIQKPNGSYECNYSGLEAGTSYSLWIVSLSDGEASNFTLQTGKDGRSQTDASLEGSFGSEDLRSLLNLCYSS